MPHLTPAQAAQFAEYAVRLERMATALRHLATMPEDVDWTDAAEALNNLGDQIFQQDARVSEILDTLTNEEDSDR